MTLPLPLRLPTSSSHRRPFFGTCPPSRQAHILHKRSRRLVAPATQAAAGSGSLHETGTYYEVLDVPRTADAQTIKSAYRRLVHKYHPDVNRDPSAAAAFMRIKAAYQVLSDDGQRAAYDRWHAAGGHEGGKQTMGGWRGGSSGSAGGSGWGSGGGGSGSGGRGGGFGGRFGGPDFWGMGWQSGQELVLLYWLLMMVLTWWRVGFWQSPAAWHYGKRRAHQEKEKAWWRGMCEAKGQLVGGLLGMGRSLALTVASPFVHNRKGRALGH